MSRFDYVAIVLFVLTSCGTIEVSGLRSSNTESELLSGAVLFGEPVEIASMAIVEPLAIYNAMRAFLLKSDTQRCINSVEKVDLIRERMTRSKLITYDASASSPHRRHTRPIAATVDRSQ